MLRRGVFLRSFEIRGQDTDNCKIYMNMIKYVVVVTQSRLFLSIDPIGEKLMPTTGELKKNGMLEFGELLELIAAGCRINVDTLRMVVSSPLGKVRSMLIDRGLIVLPTDREWACLYSPELELVFIAYLRWHRVTQQSRQRRSVASTVAFFNDFSANESHAVDHLPPRLRGRVTSRNDYRTVFPLRHGASRAS